MSIHTYFYKIDENVLLLFFFFFREHMSIYVVDVTFVGVVVWGDLVHSCADRNNLWI